MLSNSRFETKANTIWDFLRKNILEKHVELERSSPPASFGSSRVSPGSVLALFKAGQIVMIANGILFNAKLLAEKWGCKNFISSCINKKEEIPTFAIISENAKNSHSSLKKFQRHSTNNVTHIHRWIHDNDIPASQNVQSDRMISVSIKCQ